MPCLCAAARLGYLNRVVKGLVEGQRSARDHLPEGLALDVLHRDERLALLCLIDLVDMRDVGVAELRGGLGFAIETSLVVFGGKGVCG